MSLFVSQAGGMGRLFIPKCGVRFDRLRERNPKEWEFYMYRCCTDPVTGEKYGWGKVLDYIGVEWEDVPGVQIDLSDCFPGVMP